ncbi:hypothetical protein DJ568_06205 [Mucilaginibacter hurinus]|uniref:DUF4185 domain-containing protein n=1 Tax=Mucilaginibacter hurinus TaxID=2201324 RepID=A0A367GRY6_9SPHI|nr:DUF4185 domain-containing protein [Mucilaginibacter hurinus]RCH55483.1 hypothetical protein DJ568_06205 [Mucilaginibacter hurinus]
MKTKFAYSCTLLLMFCSICLAGKPDTSLTSIKFTVSEAPEWTALFNRDKGWLGADGVFALPFNGIDRQLSATDSTMLIFSDTVIGEIVDGKLKPGHKWVNNTVAIIKNRKPKKETTQFKWHTTNDGKPGTFFVPNTPNAKKGDFYWLGDGFYNAELKHTYIFGYRVHIFGKGHFDFATTGNALIAIPEGSKPPFKNHRQIETPLFFPADSANKVGYFGSAILANTVSAGVPHPDGYIYVYAIKGLEKRVLVARVLPNNFEKFDTWRFWDGKDWGTDIKAAAPIADHASDELSVTPLTDGRYLMISQIKGISPEIGMRLGRSPAGPFGPIIKVWDCKDVLLENGFYSYNAKAHPALSKPGELLVSFNVNSFNWTNDVKKHPNLYRPRFIRLKFD